MAGLLDQHRLLGNDQALDGRCSGWSAGWTPGPRALAREQMQKVLHTEFGGMNEMLANLCVRHRRPASPRAGARASTTTRSSARWPSAATRLAGRHANTDIAKVVGRRGAVGGDRRGALPHHRDVLLGPGRPSTTPTSSAATATREFFGPPGQIVSQLGENTCENCNSYNMLKLSRQLFLHAAGPGGLHGLLRVDAAQPDAGRAGPGLGARVRHLLHRALARPRAARARRAWSRTRAPTAATTATSPATTAARSRPR